MRILYVQASFVPPPTNPQTDRFYLLSAELEGDVLQPVWWSGPEEIAANLGPGSYPVYTSGRFHYHWCFAWRYKGILQRLAIFWFYLSKGWELHRKHRYDCIVAYSHMTTGLIAVLLKWMMRTKLVIEIATSPEFVYLVERPRPSWRERVMHFYSDICLHLSMWCSDRAHFLYPGQLDPYPLLRKVRNSVFHEFVTVSLMGKKRAAGEEAQTEPFVLQVGHPWYLKGTDLLIEAFKALAPDFPGLKLKLLGYFPEQTGLEELMRQRIEVLKARPNPEVLQIIRQCKILVLASRCEGMGRVLIEGMAAGVPLVGSSIGGIPFMVRDGECGLVFQGGDARKLEQKLRQLLSDPEMSQRMGDNGYRRAHEELSEAVYVKAFARMVEDTVRGNP